MIHRVLTFAALLAVSPACSQPKATPDPTEGTETTESTGTPDSTDARPSGADSKRTMPKAAWVAVARSSYTAKFCGADRHVRQCYEVTDEECTAQIRTAAATCFTQLDAEIPDQVHTTSPEPEPALFACICAEYGKALTDKASSDEQCQSGPTDPADPCTGG